MQRFTMSWHCVWLSMYENITGAAWFAWCWPCLPGGRGKKNLQTAGCGHGGGLVKLGQLVRQGFQKCAFVSFCAQPIRASRYQPISGRLLKPLCVTLGYRNNP